MTARTFHSLLYEKDADTGIVTEAVTHALDMENAALNKLFSSGDFFEALSARREKREPHFKGE